MKIKPDTISHAPFPGEAPPDTKSKTPARKSIMPSLQPAPKPHEELRLGRSKGGIGPKSLPPRRGVAR